MEHIPVVYAPGSYEDKVQKATIACLNSLPDDIILNMATREFEMGDPSTCVCGWAFRAGMLKMIDSKRTKVLGLLEQFSGYEPSDPDPLAQDLDDSAVFDLVATDRACERVFNNAAPYEWDIMYMAVASYRGLSVVELEFTERLNRIFDKPKKKRPIAQMAK